MWLVVGAKECETPKVDRLAVQEAQGRLPMDLVVDCSGDERREARRRGKTLYLIAGRGWPLPYEQGALARANQRIDRRGEADPCSCTVACLESQLSCGH